MNILSSIKAFSLSRLSWGLLFIFIAFFTACAYGFQHILMLDPCVMCVYERVAMLGVGASALIGYLNPKSAILRWIGLAGWGATSYKGLTLSMEHVHYQTSIFATCDALSFPEWAPLNKWFPAFFEAPGDCSEIAWEFLTLSMPQWLIVIFVCNLIALGVVVLSQFVKAK
ncbi:disulfide bond formation protein DsbB [Vibrio sp. JC009]|uniref:disulfide bond formation protein DsbB n=1 Tax=Vibrio sp. JC009 TaxID=2912314 RepID=UPI0023AE8F92|nr:disulfide bond formation protein DsbB [Vibrio sp. JC009]WED22646.1 disulfide bond formation protein DsbB [Vibrio sp. JC009]